jgi:branched-subunit amino acid transport protein
MKSYFALIIGMMLVTYLPRLFPLITITQRPLHPLLRRFLLYIPYTALGALIVSGIIQAETGKMAATLGGLTAAAICSWFKGGLVLSVLAAIAVGFMVLTFQ